MKIYKLKIESSEHILIEKIVPYTDISNVIQIFTDKIAKHSITNITIIPLGEMSNNYVEKKFHDKEYSQSLSRSNKPTIEDLF